MHPAQNKLKGGAGGEMVKEVTVIGEVKSSLFIHYLKKFLEVLKLRMVVVGEEIPVKDKIYQYLVINKYEQCYPQKLTSECCLLNMDYIQGSILHHSGIIVTYGFGSKNTITLSSMEEGNSLVYCIQRFIELEQGTILAPQEIPVILNIPEKEELYAVMVSVTLALISGLKEDAIRKSFASLS